MKEFSLELLLLVMGGFKYSYMYFDKLDCLWKPIINLYLVVEHSKCDIQYISRGSIKLQDLADFLVELSTPIGGEVSHA